MLSEFKQNCETSFEAYIVVRIELPEYCDILQQMNTLPGHDPAELQRQKSKVANLYGSIYCMRQTFLSLYDSFSSDASASGHLTADQKLFLQGTPNCEVIFSYFGSFVLIYAQLEAINAVPNRTIYAVMSASATLLSTYMTLGIPLQASIDIILGKEFEEMGFFNEVKAETKSTSVSHPQLIISEELNKDLKRIVIVTEAYDNWSVINGCFASLCLELISIIKGHNL